MAEKPKNPFRKLHRKRKYGLKSFRDTVAFPHDPDERHSTDRPDLRKTKSPADEVEQVVSGGLPSLGKKRR
jgi:hypothetical protein